MHRINFVHQPRSDASPLRSVRAVLASCAFHGAAVCLLLGSTLLYRSQVLPPKNGSAPGTPSISLETMVIVSPPPAPTFSTPPPVLPTAVTLPTPPLQAFVLPKIPEEGIPVLAVRRNKPAAIPPLASSTATVLTQKRKCLAAAPSSSYAPGLSILPHPPYPIEAQDRGQTGTVIMSVRFDANGDVALAEVAQSSGVPILDTETRSFICAHWHSPVYAGQTISQAVQYSLRNL